MDIEIHVYQRRLWWFRGVVPALRRLWKNDIQDNRPEREKREGTGGVKWGGRGKETNKRGEISPKMLQSVTSCLPTKNCHSSCPVVPESGILFPTG